jgi:signal transduction histidine kinase
LARFGILPVSENYKIPRPIASTTGHRMGVTLVTRGRLIRTALDWLRGFLRALDPRRSLGIKVGWLVSVLSLIFAVTAALWLGNMTQAGLLTQHCRQLALDTEELAAALDQTFMSRLQSLQAVATVLGSNFESNTPRTLQVVLSELQSTHPEMERIEFATPSGSVIAAIGAPGDSLGVAQRTWLAGGLKGSWIGDASRQPLQDEKRPRLDDDDSPIVDIATSVRNSQGSIVGVVSARLRWRWLEQYAHELRESLRHQSVPEALVLDREGRVLIGPESFRGRRWQSTHIGEIALFEPAQLDRNTGPGGGRTYAPTVSEERIDGGQVFLASRVDPPSGSALRSLGWFVLLIEPRDAAQQRADRLWMHIVLVSLALGGTAALFGIFITFRLTRRLIRLSHSVDAVGVDRAQHIEVPPGFDEVTRLGKAFANLLGALQNERGELSALSADLERRVIARTREVERLAKETRYAAVVRERLKIARDLHDTLAHSMMAMLAEIRLLRKLLVLNPAAMSDELARAEQVAHEGLNEARASITRMRFNAVRDVGLGAALTETLKNFGDRTGVQIESAFDPNAASFAEERAETVFRIAEEALRNVERHARATRITVALHDTGGARFELSIEDDGVGFDTQATYAGHFGIVGMREQAQLIGAELSLQSVPDQGTTLRVVFRVGPEIHS